MQFTQTAMYACEIEAGRKRELDLHFMKTIYLFFFLEVTPSFIIIIITI